MSDGHDTQHADGHDGDGHHGVGHIVPLKILFGTGAGLLFLTFITVWSAQYDLGEANIWVAMAIATLKASLVCLFFAGLAAVAEGVR